MIRKGIFILAHEIGDPSFYPTYRRLRDAQYRPYEELRHDQEKLLRRLISFSYDHVPYYRSLFKNLNLSPRDIRSLEDLEKLPILTKDIIRANREEFMPANLSSQKYSVRATGGSTGTPMQYRISKYDRTIGGALMYRGWGQGGYNLGDRMVFLAGSSLDTGSKSFFEKRVHEFTRNLRKLSSFDMAEAEMRQYADIITAFRPRFLRGYASSLSFFAKWLDENDVTIPPLRAIFTTAEKLFPNMRQTIGEVFGCEVFDGYGMNDGGLNSVECSAHSGMHIDTERSIMEVVDQNNRQIIHGQGTVLATSLHNFAMPFIRYSTDDIATLTDAECGCGRHSKMLSEVVGRTVDILVTPEGKKIHGWFFLMIFWEHGQGVKEYQVIQTAIDKILIKIVTDDSFEEKKLEKIKEIVSIKSPNWHVEFQEVDSIDRTPAGKFKFIINEIMS